MTWLPLPRWLASGIAVAMPLAAVVCALPVPAKLPAGVRQAPLPAPFGSVDLLAIHLLVGVGPAWLGARWLPLARTPRFCQMMTCLGIAVSLAALSMLGPVLTPWLDACAAPGTERWLARVLLCLALQTPWLLAAARPAAVPVPAVFGVALALAASAQYGAWIGHKRLGQVEELLSNQQLARAYLTLDAICLAGGAGPIRQQSPLELREALAEQLLTLDQWLRRPQPARLPPAAVVERARALAMLDRLQEATVSLEPLKGKDLQASLYLGIVLQLRGQPAASDRVFLLAKPVLTQRLPAASAQNSLKGVYDAMAFNARARGDYRAAEMLYHEALKQLPDHQAHFHFQLGRHYHQGNRLPQAREHLGRAAALGPETHAAAAAALLQHHDWHTPGCLLR